MSNSIRNVLIQASIGMDVEKEVRSYVKKMKPIFQRFDQYAWKRIQEALDSVDDPREAFVVKHHKESHSSFTGGSYTLHFRKEEFSYRSETPNPAYFDALEDIGISRRRIRHHSGGGQSDIYRVIFDTWTNHPPGLLREHYELARKNSGQGFLSRIQGLAYSASEMATGKRYIPMEARWGYSNTVRKWPYTLEISISVNDLSSDQEAVFRDAWTEMTDLKWDSRQEKYHVGERRGWYTWGILTGE
jgi:hypothetical protein